MHATVFKHDTLLVLLCSKQWGYDTSFDGVVGVGEKPNWCGSFPDEIQEITITNCVASSTTATFIDLAIVGLDRVVRNMTFACNISQNSLQTLFKSGFNATRDMGHIKVFSREVLNVNISGATTIKFRIAYQFEGVRHYNTTTNWYLPSVIRADHPLHVHLSTFQEGSITGVRTSHYDYPPEQLAEVVSVWIDSSKNQSFRFRYRNQTSSLIRVLQPFHADLFQQSLINIISGLCGSEVHTISLVGVHAGVDWVEYQITFKNNAVPSRLSITSTSFEKSIFVFVLTAANNLMLHFYNNFYGNINSKLSNNFGTPRTNSGFYNCYKREDNYEMWSYDTGFSDDGVVGEVNSTHILY